MGLGLLKHRRPHVYLIGYASLGCFSSGPNVSALLNDLFALQSNDERPTVTPDTDVVARATNAIERVLRDGKSLSLSYSSGKDSSAMVNVALNAALNILRDTGTCPALYVLHSDTGVESPVVRSLADKELARMRTFATRHGLPLHIHVTQPSLNSGFAMRVISGRALPSFPNTNGDCTISLKIQPLTRCRKQIAYQATENGNSTVTCIGTRADESTARSINTAARGETDFDTWFGPEGDERLSPLLQWSSDDVWTYLGEAAAGLYPAYSDFRELMEFYADAGGSSCIIVADMRSAANSRPCGARSGCFTCLRTKDRSAEQMIRQNPARYDYLVPLLEFRNYFEATQWDFSLRNWVGRTIDASGYINIRPDVYSPEMCQRLLRYALAAQDEANALGSPSHVQIVGPRELIGLDFIWSIRAMAPPYTALRIWLEHQRGERCFAPTVEHPVPPGPVPDIGRIHVGSDWDDEASPLFAGGLRQPVWELFNESCGPSLRLLPNGKTVMRLHEEPEFDVDEEGASLFLEFEAERLVREYEGFTGDWTAAAMTYLTYGVVVLAKGQSSSVDCMMRRAQWLQRHDLHGQRSPAELRERCTTLSKQQQVPLF